MQAFATFTRVVVVVTFFQGCGSTSDGVSVEEAGAPDGESLDDAGSVDATVPADSSGADVDRTDSNVRDAGADVNLDPPVPCTTTCDAGDGCFEKICCPPPTASGAFTLPSATSYVHWTFASPVSTLAISLRFHNDPGTTEGLYLSLGGGSIDQTGFYFGVQTNLYKPNVGDVGKGFIFSEFGYADLSYVRPGPGGFTQADTYEGAFAGVRLPYDWTSGDYIVTLKRNDALGESDWYDLDVTPPAGGVIYVGGVRFPRARAGVPARINAAIPGFHEVYSGTGNYAAVPRWHVSMMMTGDGARVPTASSEFPQAYPNEPKFPNVDVWYDPAGQRVHVAAGGSTPKCHAAGKLF